MKSHFKICAFAATAFAMSVSSSLADEIISIKTVLAPKESISMNFHDGTKHFVVLILREGKSEGQGSLAGADVVEYGWHDVNPPHGADVLGYLQFRTSNGDIANLKWRLNAVFIKGEEKPRLVDYGHWTLFSGTGQFANATGVGTMSIQPVSPTDRLFTLNGEIGPKP
ncbi:MAG: hypothetical protein R3337_13745 [Gammaproteobacteria bacterium]|nr:hypothetical protein [Gammaproteobacteria bacterium]